MKKYQEIKKYIVLQKKLNLYVAESHYFDAKGKRQITLTDVEELAEEMDLAQANSFIQSEKNSTDYDILEAYHFEDQEEEFYEQEN